MSILRIGDRIVSYKVLGDFKKEPLLMLCGLGMPMATWGSTAKRFAKDFTVIMWDYPGLGRSSKLANDYTTLDLANDSATLLGHLGLRRTHVVGYSMGELLRSSCYITQRARKEDCLSCQYPNIGWHVLDQSYRRGRDGAGGQ